MQLTFSLTTLNNGLVENSRAYSSSHVQSHIVHYTFQKKYYQLKQYFLSAHIEELSREV